MYTVTRKLITNFSLIFITFLERLEFSSEIKKFYEETSCLCITSTLKNVNSAILTFDDVRAIFFEAVVYGMLSCRIQCYSVLIHGLKG